MGFYKPLLFILLLCMKTGANAWSAESASVQLSWHAIKGATQYHIVIGKDPAVSKIVHQIMRPASEPTQIMTPSLPPGTYYFVVTGLSATKKTVGKTPHTPLVVASPMDISGSRYGLPAPTPQAPGDQENIPPHTKIHFVWSKVKEAHRYRFRIWYEEQVEKDKEKGLITPPLWVTETERNWLDVTDIPPSSYMLPKEGHYRWRIASVTGTTDQDIIVGDEAESFFYVSRNTFLQAGETLATFQQDLGPFWYRGYSAIYHSNTTWMGRAHHWGADLAYWPQRNWGVRCTGGLTRLVGSPHVTELENVFLWDLSVDATYRRFLSDVSFGGGLWGGWVGSVRFGATLRNLFQVNAVADKHLPFTMGPHWGFGLIKNFTQRFNFDLGVTGFLPLYTFSAATQYPIVVTLIRPLNMEPYLKFSYTFGSVVSVSLGVKGVYSDTAYRQELETTTNLLRSAQLHTAIGIKL